MKKSTETISANIVSDRSNKAANKLLKEITAINKRFTGLEAEYADIDYEPDYESLRQELASTFANLIAERKLIIP